MQDKILGIAAATLIGASLSSAGWAATADTKFLEDAIKGSIAEVKIGQLAQQNGASADVKVFGAKLESDHSAAMDKATALAKTMNIPVPTEVTTTAHKEYERLQKLNGAAFDKAFLAAMVKDHKKDIREFKLEAKGTDQVAQFAQATLPTLQDHLKTAESLEVQQK